VERVRSIVERVSVERVLKQRLTVVNLGLALCLASCAGKPPSPSTTAVSPVQGRALIERSIPSTVQDRAGWATDMYAAFTVLALQPSRENVCAVVAVIEQESNFHVDPVIPNLPAVAWREIDSRAARAGMPRAIVHGVLELKSPTGQSYSDRIDHARTEKQLSDIFEDFTGSVPLGRSLFASWNPIRTRGPMQVNVAFAKQFSEARPYPYPVKVSIADEVFTRRGSLYFGTAHLLDYPAAYERYLYRFADFNAGQYASRNAAFQMAVSTASGLPLAPDGALVSHDADASGPGDTELAVRSLESRLKIGDAAIRAALEQGKSKEFERTPLYQHVFVLAEQAAGHPLPRAAVPRIELQGPKITRRLTTDWYAHRVDERFQRCLSR
jgi:hypothetical protein